MSSQTWIRREFGKSEPRTHNAEGGDAANEGTNQSQQGYFAFAETEDNKATNEFEHDVMLFHKGRPLVFLKSYISKRASDFGADQVLPLEHCLYHTVWEQRKIRADEENEGDFQDKDGSEDSQMLVKDRMLLIVTPNPGSHPWIKEIRRNLQKLKALYRHGACILQSINSLKEVAQVFGSDGGRGDQGLGSNNILSDLAYDLMYVCDPVVEETVDMVHMLDETKSWLDIVVPRDEDQKGSMNISDPKIIAASVAHAFFVTFGGNMESPCPGAGLVMGFGRTIQAENAFDSVTCSLVDMDPLDVCPAEQSFHHFYEQILLDKEMHYELELAIRDGTIVLPRLKRIDFTDGNAPKKDAELKAGSLSEGHAADVEDGDASAPEAEETDEGKERQDGTSKESRAVREVAQYYNNYCMKQGIIGDLSTLHFEACEMPKLSDPHNVIVQV